MKQLQKKSVVTAMTLALIFGISLVGNAKQEAAPEVFSDSVMTTSYMESVNGKTQSQTMTFHQRTAQQNGQSQSSFSMTNGNGGSMAYTASHQQLISDFLGNNMQSIDLQITNHSIWKGSINQDKKANFVKITLDKTSAWEATADSYVTVLNDADVTLKNISSKHIIFYDAKALENSWLLGKTYKLQGGGQLKPMP